MSAETIVVGGGVIGLTTAVVLAERGERVRVWARDPAADCTSAVAGGLCWPYRIEPQALVEEWSLRSLDVYVPLAAEPSTTGVRLVTGTMADTRPGDLGRWAQAVPGLREATPGGPGLRATVPLIDMPTHLSYLEDRLAAAGGRVERRTVTDLRAASAEAGVVVNCTGLGARSLAADPSVQPVRGQLVVVENPGVEEWFVATGGGGAAETTYLLPQPYGLVLGGTAEEGEWSREPDPGTAAAIVERCARVRPEVADARVLAHRVGLRPARPTVRLERERVEGGGVLVHNYGHGGAGVTVAWGCAEAAAGLAG
ncbi:FAD-dependent oxidoreductase [Streptomyces sp. B-S-A8]|uniref:D-amino-acid oxidase n=1 Tax=Streptomyces solicavernae TaxID=3043614 RepID=A0ABT6RLU9_9ACTN|nr:FAD-dependent oxidoreductase [Streptomyces sp. B-S-A8]MDI3385413.1 FAD-dependent oxidoreductase [Streptomyces sp. B-S-A8]